MSVGAMASDKSNGSLVHLIPLERSQLCRDGFSHAPTSYHYWEEYLDFLKDTNLILINLIVGKSTYVNDIHGKPNFLEVVFNWERSLL